MKKIIISLLLLVVFCMVSWAEYAGSLDVQRLRILDGAIWVEFDRVPWGGRYTYYGFTCIIKQENTDPVLYKGMVDFLINAYINEILVDIWFINHDDGSVIQRNGAIMIPAANLSEIINLAYTRKSLY